MTSCENCKHAWASVRAADKDNQKYYERIAELETHVEQLQDKVSGDDCACSYDNPNDVCSFHSPIVNNLKAERDRLREALGEFMQSRKDVLLVGQGMVKVEYVHPRDIYLDEEGQALKDSEE